jgi:hypothetical protein
MRLKLQKDALGHRVIMHKVNPRKFAKVIYETDIIHVTTNRNWSRSPNIRKDKLKGFGGAMYGKSIW